MVAPSTSAMALQGHLCYHIPTGLLAVALCALHLSINGLINNPTELLLDLA